MSWLLAGSFEKLTPFHLFSNGRHVGSHPSINFFLRQPAPKTAFLSTIQTVRWIGYPSFGFILKNIQILYHRLCPSPCRAPSCNIVETTARRSIAPRPERRASNVHRSGLIRIQATNNTGTYRVDQSRINQGILHLLKKEKYIYIYTYIPRVEPG